MNFAAGPKTIQNDLLQLNLRYSQYMFQSMYLAYPEDPKLRKRINDIISVHYTAKKGTTY